MRTESQFYRYSSIVKTNLILRNLLAVLLFCGFSSIAAKAAPVVFSFTGKGSGNLDTTVFTDASFEVIISADTDDMYYHQPDIPVIGDLSGTIEISGIGIGTFISPLYVFNNQTTLIVGFNNRIQYDLIDLCVEGVGLETYDLTTSLGQ